MAEPVDEKAERGVTYRTMEAATALVIMAFGALFCWSSYRLGFGWGIEGPQSGVFPFYVSLSIVVASLFVLWHAVYKPGAKGHEVFVTWEQLRRVLSVLVPAGLFVLGVQLIGIYVAAVIYIALFMRFIGHYGWVRSVGIALTVAVVAFLLFEVWFQVPLYKGIWNLTGWTGY
jgi:hypothetical protein